MILKNKKAEPNKKARRENLIKFHAAFDADTAIQNVTRQPKILKRPINFHCPSGGELVSGLHATLPKTTWPKRRRGRRIRAGHSGQRDRQFN